MPEFLREGWWCDCERSCNVAKGALESGVSVYECDNQGGLWKPGGLAWQKNGDKRVGASDLLWLVVEGDPQLDVGGDREPLLKNVRVVRRVTWNSSMNGFADAGVISRQARNHAGFPTCVCDGGVEFFKKMVDAQYGDDEDEDDEDEDDEAGTDAG